MIQLFNKEKIKVALLRDYTDLKIESLLESGDKTLSFSYAKNSKYYDEIVEEGYIKTKSNEFVIKAKDMQQNYTTFTCKLNVEDLEGKIFDRFVSVEETILNVLNLALVGTGWKVGKCSLKKKRTVRKTNCSSWEIIQEIKKTYRVDIVFNTLVKEIEVYEHLGEDRGTYFIDSLNLKSLHIQGNSYKYATRIIAEGKNKLTIANINNGKNYVENYQYSNKIKTVYWKDDRYTVAESLKADAEAKLNEISKPYCSYSANIINFTKINKQYKNITDYNLGDTITLISKNNKIKEKQRIVKIVEYPDDHLKDTIELANSMLRFEDIQKEFQETTDTVDNITIDDGTIDGSTVDSIQVKQIEDFKANVIEVTNLKAVNADIEHLKVNKADIQDLNAVKGHIGTLEATTINTTQFKALEGQIDFFKSNYSKIHDLEVTNEKVKIIEGKVSNFNEVLAGNITVKNIATNAITANSGIIADGAIGSAQISSLDVNKLNAGDIDTSKINLVGPLRRLKIVGDKIQILDNKDGKLYERIMLGVDDNNNSTLILRGADGKTILLNQDGLTNAGFTEGYGRVKDNTLDASKFEKNSIVRQVNNATETIKSTKVTVGDRTLDVELSTQNNKITDHSKELYTQKSSINALDNAIKLKVDNQIFTKTTNTINTAIVNSEKNITSKAKEYTDSITKKLKEDSEKYANDVAIAKAELAKQQAQAHADGKITEEEKARIKQATDNLNTALSKAKEIQEISKIYTDSITKKLKEDSEKYANDVAIAKAELAKQQAQAHADGKITEEEKARIKQATDNLNTALSKAKEAENLSKRYADKITEDKKNEAVKNSKDYTNTQITTVNTNLHKVTSKLDILENQISTKVSQVDIDKSIVKSKSTNYGYTYKKDIIIYGDDNLYYPIIIKGGNQDVKRDILVNRSYSEQAPKEWNDSTTHKGGLTLSIKANFGGWGGANYSWDIYSLEESYTRMFAGATNCAYNMGFAIFLRGGGKTGAIYHLYSNQSLEGDLFWDRTDIPKPNKLQVAYNKDLIFYCKQGETIYTDFAPAPRTITKEVEKEISNKKFIELAHTTANELVITNDKISNVSSELKQTKDSFNLSINSLKNTTSTIETNINNVNKNLLNNISNNLNTAKSYANDIAISKSNQAVIDSRKIPDTRNKNESPDWYIKNYPRQTIVEFKLDNIIKIPNNKSVYGTLETKIPWGDSSGGYPVQVFRSNSQPTFQRWGVDSKTWSEWLQIEDIIGSQNKANTALNNSKDYTNVKITTVNTKVSNVESGLKILKNEISTKVNQVDIDKTVKDINNKIKSSDEKINQASSEFKQTTDTLKADLEKVKSTTKTTENILNNKANKSEVSNVSSQVTTVQANLNNISQKISHTESNVNKINKDITTFNSKINSVEQKITPNSLTNTVLSSQQYKNNINETNFLRERFTKFQQNTDSFLLNVKNGGTNNILLNGNFEGNLFNTWERWGNPSEISILGSTGSKYLKLCVNFKNQGLRQVVKVEPHTTYTFSCQCENDQKVISLAQVDNAGDYPGVEIKGNGKFSFTFTTKNNDMIFVYIGRGSGGTNGVSRWFWTTLTKGNSSYNSYIPNANEICGSTININEKQIRADYSDGSYSIMGSKGFEHWHNGMARPYHYLFHRGSVDKVNSQQTVRIHVPEEFRGKEFGMSWWAGNVFPQNHTDLIFSANVELIDQNKKEGWFDLKASLMVRNPQNESSPFWRGKMNIIYTLIA